MKKILFVAIALCFVFAGSFETYAQKRQVVKKPVKRKLVKCRVNGKIVYRTKCRETKVKNPEATVENPVIQPTIIIPPRTNGQGGGLGNGRGTGNGTGIGTGRGSGNGNTEQTVKPDPNVRPDKRGTTQNLQILSKPRAIYTDEARNNQVQGNVVLRVTFLANGTIGDILVVTGLPNGLTEQAVNAAKLIRFEPAKRNGVPYTVTRIISYSFTLY